MGAGMYLKNTALNSGSRGLTVSAGASPWANVPMGPPDKIFGLNVLFNEDKSLLKVNLGIGAYRDDNGKPVVLKSVKEAERRIFDRNMDHEYAGIAGLQSFVDRSVEFAYGEDSPAIKDKRVAAVPVSYTHLTLPTKRIV